MPDWLHFTRFGLTLFAMLVGLFGLIVPVFPGIVVIWLAALVYGILSGGFVGWGIFLFILITLFMIAGTLVDNVLVSAGAVKGGASMRSMWVGIAAGIIFTVILPPLGGIIAAPLAVLLLEYRRHHEWGKAVQALRGMAVGWGMAFVVRFGMGIVMIGLWILWDIII